MPRTRVDPWKLRWDLSGRVCDYACSRRCQYRSVATLRSVAFASTAHALWMGDVTSPLLMRRPLQNMSALIAPMPEEGA